MRIAVAGNPNAGKTTLFNAITGARARVGNYPGVTVERKEAAARLPSGAEARFVDLPGCYSLTARSPEEEVAHRVLVGSLGAGRPDVIVCVVDATQLARGLYLVVQLLEMGLPVVVALNMMDVARAQGVQIDIDLLSRRLGLPVVPTSARYGDGLRTLLDTVEAQLGRPLPSVVVPLPDSDTAAIAAVRTVLAAQAQPESLGVCLWLLTSDLDTGQDRGGQVRVPLSPAVREVVRLQKLVLDPEQLGVFNRRVITARYTLVDTLLHGVLDTSARQQDSRTQALDRVLLHPVWGLAVFVSAMFVLFQAVFAWAEPLMALVERSMAAAASLVTTVVPASHTQSLLINGVIAGVGNVLTFLPQIALLFFGLTLLEESGYMARAAFLLDRTMRSVGLHGKAFIPLMSSFACAVPGIMATRTVESSRDRLVTIMVAPFMSCSARLPIYTLVIAACFASSKPWFGVLSVGGVVIFAMYFLGFVAAIGTAFILKRTLLRSPAPALLLELPLYRAPALGTVLRLVGERCKIFVRQTGSIILALSVLLWAILTFPQQGLDAAAMQQRQDAITAQGMAAEPTSQALRQLQREDQALRLENSFGGRLGRAIEPMIQPLGFDWRIGIGLIASFAAREVLVSTLGQVYALDADVPPDSPSLRDALRRDVDPATGQARFTPLVGISLLVFFVLALQCLSTFATVKRETNSWRWPILQLVYMNGLAYVASFIVYQTGHALGLG